MAFTRDDRKGVSTGKDQDGIDDYDGDDLTGLDFGIWPKEVA